MAQSPTNSNLRFANEIIMGTLFDPNKCEGEKNTISYKKQQ